MGARLQVVRRDSYQVHGLRTFEINEPKAPAGFHIRYDSTDPHARKPRRGEITRLVKAFLAKFYRELDPEIKHETLDLYELQGVITGKLGAWLRGLLQLDCDYYVPPCIIAHMLRSTEVDGCYFEVKADTVRLMAKEEGKPKASISIRLRES